MPPDVNARTVLPIPARPPQGPTTFDAKDPRRATRHSSRCGRPAYLTTVAAEDSEVIALSIDQLRGVIAANQQLGDLILGAFVVRRALAA
jgi:hypothetical protein